MTQPPSGRRIAVIVPAVNEEGKIGRLLGKIPPGIVDLVVVVDDGSSDGTAEEARRSGATVLTHVQNRGVGAAIRTGIDHARRQGFEIATILAGDDQHDPAELPAVVGPIVEGRADLVQGSRRLADDGAKGISLFRSVATRLYTLFFRLATGFPSTDATNSFRAFRLSILDDEAIDLWQDWLDTYELEPYLLYKSIATGKRVTEVPVTVFYHNDGTTKMKAVRDWWRITRPLVFLALGWKR